MSKRDEIAKYLFGLYDRTLDDWSDDPDRMPPRNRAVYRNQADAILDILAEPDEKMVDAAVDALHESSKGFSWSTKDVRAAITAAMRAAKED